MFSPYKRPTIVEFTDPATGHISAAVSVTAPLGSRTFVVSSESLPEELRDGLVAAWGGLNE